MYGKAQGEEAAVNGIQLFDTHDVAHIVSLAIPTATNIATVNGMTAVRTIVRNFSIMK